MQTEEEKEKQTDEEEEGKVRRQGKEEKGEEEIDLLDFKKKSLKADIHDLDFMQLRQQATADEGLKPP